MNILRACMYVQHNMFNFFEAGFLMDPAHWLARLAGWQANPILPALPLNAEPGMDCHTQLCVSAEDIKHFAH